MLFIVRETKKKYQGARTGKSESFLSRFSTSTVYLSTVLHTYLPFTLNYPPFSTTYIQMQDGDNTNKMENVRVRQSRLFSQLVNDNARVLNIQRLR